MSISRALYLGFSLTPYGHHPNAWRLAASPDAQSFGALLGQVHAAELAGFRFVVLSDRPGEHPTDALSPLAVPFEPTTLVAALSTQARGIGFFAAASMRRHEPYNLARRIASLDLISHGRTGWIVRSDTAATERDRDYVNVVSGLWDSWEEDAFVYDKDGGRFFLPEKMHVLNHTGVHFSVRGPLNVNRSSQGKPVVASGSTSGSEPPAAHLADVFFVAGGARENAGTVLGERATSLASHGRARAEVRIIADVMPFIGSTRTEAQGIYEHMEALSPHRLAQPIPLPLLVGTVEDIADQLQHWFETGDVDGFTLLPPTTASLFHSCETLMPELRKRGLVRTAVPGSTLRQHLDLPHPHHPAVGLGDVA